MDTPLKSIINLQRKKIIIIERVELLALFTFEYEILKEIDYMKKIVS